MNYSSWLGRVYWIQFFFTPKKYIFFMTRTFIGYLPSYCTGVRRCFKFWTFHTGHARVSITHTAHINTCVCDILPFMMLCVILECFFFFRKNYLWLENATCVQTVCIAVDGVWQQKAEATEFFYTTHAVCARSCFFRCIINIFRTYTRTQ